MGQQANMNGLNSSHLDGHIIRPKAAPSPPAPTAQMAPVLERVCVPPNLYLPHLNNWKVRGHPRGSQRPVAPVDPILRQQNQASV